MFVGILWLHFNNALRETIIESLIFMKCVLSLISFVKMSLGLIMPGMWSTSTSFDWWNPITIFPQRFRCLIPFEVTEAAHWTEALSEWSVDGDAPLFSIGDTVMRTFLMVPRAEVSSCWMDTWVPGGKWPWMVSILFLSILQVRKPSKRRELGKLVMGSLDSSSRNPEGNSNWKLLDCRRWLSCTYHPYLLRCHIGYVLVIWNI